MFKYNLTHVSVGLPWVLQLSPQSKNNVIGLTNLRITRGRESDLGLTFSGSQRK